MKPAIAYYRVSTARQGSSGLGMAAQKAAVESWARANDARLLGSYCEVESGKHNDRPQLQAALLHAKRSRATLVVAKLDRLSRNAAFLLTLMESKLPIVCCDNPAATELTIGLLAIIASHERKMISERTKAALQAAKARGTKLGSAREGHWQGREDARLNGLKKGRTRSAKVQTELAQKAHAELRPIIAALRGQQLTLDEIAERLNADGWTTRRGHKWNRVTVCKFLSKCK